MFVTNTDPFHAALFLVHAFCISLALFFALRANASNLRFLLLNHTIGASLQTRPWALLSALVLVSGWMIATILDEEGIVSAFIPISVHDQLILATVLSILSFLTGQSLSNWILNRPGRSTFVHTNIKFGFLILGTSLSITLMLFALVVAFFESMNLLQARSGLTAFLFVSAAVALVLMFLLSSRILISRIFNWSPIAKTKSGHTDIPETSFQMGQSAAARSRSNPGEKNVSQPPSEVSMAQALKKCRWALAGVFVISFVTNLLMLTGPIFMLQIYDRVLTSRSIQTLAALLVLVAVLFLFLGILELLRSRILVRVGQRVDRHINYSVFKNFIRIGSSEEATRKRALLQDLDSVRQFFASSAPASMFDLPWAPLYFAVIFLFHPVLGYLAISGAALLFLISLYNEFATRSAVKRAGELSFQSASIADSGKRNAEVLHAMGMFDAFQQRWLNVYRESISQNLVAADVSGSVSVTSKVTRLFLQSLMLAAGAYYAVVGEISPGVIIAASIILSRALAPIEQIVGQWRNVISVRQSFTRLSDALDDEKHTDARISLPKPKGYLSTERLYAASPGSTEPILKDLNFSVGPGDAVAVVGSNASGKSTLARVLVGVWPPLRGSVRLDGASLNQWLPRQLGKSIGYLPQDVELFDGTVAENISRFDPDAAPETIVEAAKRAFVHDLIVRLPDGYATRFGEGGVSISGGQRQRIALARALYGNPPLIVLDEPNANLDNEGELALTAAITALRESGCAIVVMAHRPNILSAVNLVLVLRDGRQVSFGEKSKALKDNVTEVVPRHGKKKDARATVRIV